MLAIQSAVALDIANICLQHKHAVCRLFSGQPTIWRLAVDVSFQLYGLIVNNVLTCGMLSKAPSLYLELYVVRQPCKCGCKPFAAACGCFEGAALAESNQLYTRFACGLRQSYVVGHTLHRYSPNSPAYSPTSPHWSPTDG